MEGVPSFPAEDAKRSSSPEGRGGSGRRGGVGDGDGDGEPTMGARLVWLVCFRARLCALRVMSAWRGHSPHRGPGITAGLSFRVAAPALTCVGRVARLVRLVESELSDRLAKVTLVFCTAPIGLAPQASSPQHSVGFEGIGMQRAQHPDGSSGRLGTYVRHEDLYALKERIHLCICDGRRKA